jgi:hypothetical protein
MHSSRRIPVALLAMAIAVGVVAAPSTAKDSDDDGSSTTATTTAASTTTIEVSTPAGPIGDGSASGSGASGSTTGSTGSGSGDSATKATTSVATTPPSTTSGSAPRVTAPAPPTKDSGEDDDAESKASTSASSSKGSGTSSKSSGSGSSGSAAKPKESGTNVVDSVAKAKDSVVKAKVKAKESVAKVKESVAKSDGAASKPKESGGARKSSGDDDESKSKGAERTPKPSSSGPSETSRRGSDHEARTKPGKSGQRRRWSGRDDEASGARGHGPRKGRKPRPGAPAWKPPLPTPPNVAEPPRETHAPYGPPVSIVTSVPVGYAVMPAPRHDRAAAAPPALSASRGPRVTEASVQEPSVIDVAALTAAAASTLREAAVAIADTGDDQPQGEPVPPLPVMSGSAPVSAGSPGGEPPTPSRERRAHVEASTGDLVEPRETIQIVGLPHNGRTGVDLTIPLLAAMMVAVGFYLGSQRAGTARRGRQ